MTAPIEARHSDPSSQPVDVWRVPDWNRDFPHLLGLRRAASEVDWSRPLVAVDVDGVLAPFDDERSSAWSDFVPHQVAGFTMAFSTELSSRLAALDASRVWLTTWELEANRCLVDLLSWEPLPTLVSDWRTRSFPPHPQVPVPSPGPGLRWWKLNVLSRFLRFAADDPYGDGLCLPPALVWMDDELDDAPVAQRWAARLPFPTLLVSPSPNLGVSRFELEQVEAFVASHRKAQ